MKLALITGEFPPLQGGVADYTRALACEFVKRGLEVKVVTSGDSPSPPTPQCGGEGERSSGEGRLPYTINHTNFKSFRSLPQVDRLTRDCDIVHIQYQAAAYGLSAPIHLLPRYLHWKAPRRKVLVTFHDLKVPYLFPKAGRLRWQAVLFLARACGAVVATNEEDLRSLTTSCRPPSPVFRLIPIGSNIVPTALTPTQRAATRTALGVQPDESLLCYFGFLNASKGGETLVRVLANVVRAGYNARLLMLGGEIGASDPTNAAYAQKVKSLIAEFGMSQRVIWAGYRPASEVSALWQASDIAVLPYADGVSLRRGTLMAALAHAMPIVSTAPSVPIAELHDGENIALAAPGDVAALAAKVIELIESPALRQRLAQGATQVAQAFKWPHIADQHLALYQSILLTTLNAIQ